MTWGFKHTGCTKNVCSIQYLSLIFSDLVLLSFEEFWAVRCISNGQNSMCFRNKNCLTSKETDVPTEISTFGAQGSSPSTLSDWGIMITQLKVHQVRRCLACGLCYSDRSSLHNMSYIPYCCGCQPNSIIKCEI